MDELDLRIMSAIAQLGGSATLQQLIDLLDATYPIRYTRARVRNHANCLVKYRFITRTTDPEHDRPNGNQVPPYHYNIIKSD